MILKYVGAFRMLFFFSHLIWFNFLFLKNENMNIFLIKALAALYTPSMLCGF